MVYCLGVGGEEEEGFKERQGNLLWYLHCWLIAVLDKLWNMHMEFHMHMEYN